MTTWAELSPMQQALQRARWRVLEELDRGRCRDRSNYYRGCECANKCDVCDLHLTLAEMGSTMAYSDGILHAACRKELEDDSV